MRLHSSRLLLGAIGFLSALIPAELNAQAAPRSLSVHTDACAADLVDRRALQIELSTLGVSVSDDGDARLLVTCAASEGPLNATYTNPETGRFVERRIRVPESPSSRRRELAIHLVETLRAVWPELAERQEPARLQSLEEQVVTLQRTQREANDAMRASAERSEEARAQAVEREARAAQDGRNERAILEGRLSDLESAEDFRSTFIFARASAAALGGLVLGGAELGVERRVGPLRLVVGTRALVGRTTHETGDIRLRLFSASFALMLPAQAGPLLLSVGPRLRVGIAIATGLPDDPARTSGSTIRGALFAAELASAIWLWASPSWRVGFDVAVSYALGGVDAAAADSRIARTQGASLSAGFGAALAF